MREVATRNVDAAMSLLGIGSSAILGRVRSRKLPVAWVRKVIGRLRSLPMHERCIDTAQLGKGKPICVLSSAEMAQLIFSEIPDPIVYEVRVYFTCSSTSHLHI